MAVTIKLKRDTAANWTSNNPTLAAGEMGIETDTNKFKFGDGSTAWTSLSYSIGDTSIPLNGLTDVAAQSPNDGDVIQYDSANSKWVTAAPASGGSYGDSDVSSYLNGGWNFHLIPDTNATYDIGSAEKKVRHFYLSPNSLTIGDTPFSEANVDRSMEVYVDQPAPVSSTAEGKKGDVRVVGSFMYVCVDTNTWVRSPVDTNW